MFQYKNPFKSIFQTDDNARVRLRVGGDFQFDPVDDTSTEHLIFIAGGVGINPLRSILLESIHQDDKANIDRYYHLLYSARSELELYFKVLCSNFVVYYVQCLKYLTIFFVFQGRI